eukprot:3882955-Amphidinium_carterae.1
MTTELIPRSKATVRNGPSPQPEPRVQLYGTTGNKVSHLQSMQNVGHKAKIFITYGGFWGGFKVDPWLQQSCQRQAPNIT